MPSVADLVYTADGLPLGSYVVQLRARTAAADLGLPFDDQGRAVVAGEQIDQLRRILLAAPEAVERVSPVDLDFLRERVSDSQIADALAMGATWAELLLGAAAATKLAREISEARTAGDVQVPTNRAARVPEGMVAGEAAHARLAELHAARVRGTQSYELAFELRCLGVTPAGIWNRSRAELAELLLAAHGWPARFPREWVPVPGVSRESARSAEATVDRLPYDPGDVVESPAIIPSDTVDP